MPLRVMLVPGLLLIAMTGPGMLLVARLGLAPLERLVAACGLSCLLSGMAVFCVYALGLPAWGFGLVLMLCAVAFAAALPGLRGLARDPEARAVMGWFALVAAWTLALLCLIRGYSGGGWVGDWLEHHERALFFLERRPLETTFLDYALPARPPLFNLIGALLLAVPGGGFPAFQVTATLLNLMAFLSACLLARAIDARWVKAMPALAAFFMFNPMMMQNATYSWTKLLSAFFVVSSIAFYAAAMRGPAGPRRVIAAALMAGGLLTHYSAAPYAIFLFLHFVIRVLPEEPAAWKEAAAGLLVVALALAPWLGWSAATYGLEETLASTSTVRDSSGLSIQENVLKVVRNVWYTLAPNPLREAAAGVVRQENRPGFVRDYFFILYQVNALFALGLAGAPLLIRQIAVDSRARGAEAAGRGFWIGLALFCGLAGVAAHGTEVPLGLAHIGLQPLVLMGLAWLAVRLPGWPSTARRLAMAGLVVDLVLGIALHVWLQSRAFGRVPAGPGLWRVDMSDQLATSAYLNWNLKTRNDLAFLRDLALDARVIVVLLAAGIAAYALRRLASLAPGPSPRAARGKAR